LHNSKNCSTFAPDLRNNISINKLKRIEIMRKIEVYWDTDGEDVDLPEVVEVPEDIDDEDIADYISDEYGWCVESWCDE